MASTGQKIAAGCGIGCLLLVIVFGGIGTCGYFGIKKVVDEAESLEVVYDDLAQRHGPPESYSPPADGRLEPLQMELFLTVREAMLAEGAELDQILRTLDDGEGGKPGVVAKFRAGASFLPAVIRYMEAHSGTLLAQGMGLGEYAYLYTLGYYVMLGHDPGDGPDFELNSDPGDENERGVQWNVDTEDAGAHERRARNSREAINTLMREVLANQREAAALAAVDPDWLDALDRELDNLREDWERLPWEDGLPPRLDESLAPYRSRLEATWSPYLNALELGALVD